MPKQQSPTVSQKPSHGKRIEDFNIGFQKGEVKQKLKCTLREFNKLEPDSAMKKYTLEGLSDAYRHLDAELKPNLKEKDFYSDTAVPDLLLLATFPVSLFLLYSLSSNFRRLWHIGSDHEAIQDTLNIYDKYQHIQNNLEQIRATHPEMSEVCNKISTLSEELFTHGLKIAHSGRIKSLEGKRFNQHLNHLSALTFKLAHNPSSEHAQAFTQYKQSIKQSPWLKIQLAIKSIFSAFNKLTQRHSNEAPSDKELRLDAAQLGLSQEHERQAKSIAKTSLPFLDHARSNQPQDNQQAVELIPIADQ
ncbi:hypothetical protein AVI51_06505 [Piscirickettsia salmonis]|uniref:Uncharacterized protein n=1 Tax=Piscirickettsia salmonis TaxID=1238 RepID=A0A9Q5V8I9_PISSA|nr:hypothetical protein [Piscirickettsia salmonis]ALA25736.1 glycosyltransferase [Piscirickettsia salmonis]APS43224.1 hypothetical protein AVI48_01735 [Piscirickettsia salmonis]APS46573.1 hypothetical protein AVI49_02335 [Piscirickettsia salmonis]APS50542.1 hypothetical protein AVI50_06580 [Piscirickettsia salmonis]APS53745.1 hypothetical protein AVI51_06505 [Piscirickettsia salmonis]